MRLNERERRAWLNALRLRLDSFEDPDSGASDRQEAMLRLAVEFEPYLRANNPTSPLLRMLEEHRQGR